MRFATCAEKDTWVKPVMRGEIPKPRDSHTCTAIGQRLYVFGGTDGANGLSDLTYIDTSEYVCMHVCLHVCMHVFTHLGGE